MSILTREPTNWLDSAKHDVTRPTATVVYNTCYHLFQKTFMRDRASTRMGELTATTIGHQPFV